MLQGDSCQLAQQDTAHHMGSMRTWNSSKKRKLLSTLILIMESLNALGWKGPSGGHSIVEGHKVGQAGPGLGEAMLAVSNCLPVFSMASGRICSMIFPGTEVRLTGQ